MLLTKGGNLKRRRTMKIQKQMRNTRGGRKNEE